MALTLSQLLTTQTATDLKAKLLANLQARGYPSTDWVSGSIDRSLLEMFSDSLADQTLLVPEIVSGGFLELSSEDWLTLLAEQIYQLTRNAATYTEGNVLLTAATGVGPTLISVGQLKVKSPLGNVYQNITGGTVPLSGTLTLSFRSISPNDSANGLNYIDGNNTIVEFLVGVPGISPTNPPPTFSPVTLVGNGTGTVTPSGATPTPSSVVIRIDSSGDVGVATFSYRINGGLYVSGGTVVASFAIPGIGVTVAFANGAGTPNSFLKDDAYYFVTTGSWITSQGTDEELDEALRIRCRGRWPSLSLVPTEDLYVTFARTASASVTQARARASTTIAGGIDLIIAGQAGSLAPAVVSTVQTYVDQRAPLNDRALVQSATGVAVTLSASVTVKLANLAQAQSEAQTNVSNSIRTAGIAGTYYLAQATEDIMRATGVTNVQNLKINGSPIDLILTGTQVGTFTQPLSTGLTWITF